jgi:hypothetical protein
MASDTTNDHVRPLESEMPMRSQFLDVMEMEFSALSFNTSQGCSFFLRQFTNPTDLTFVAAFGPYSFAKGIPSASAC